MIILEALKEIVESQNENIKKENQFANRNLGSKINKNAKQAIIISGIRRSGKSTLLQMLMQQTDSFNYFNFEDSRATDFELSDFEKLYQIQISLNPASNLFFYDEIQNIDGWERYIRTLLDRNKKVFITGSNASLLSYELGTKLTGRHLRYELFPFSYNETLDFKNLKPNLQSFEYYLKNGGFPEYLESEDNRMLQELFKDILYRDIFVRQAIRSTKEFKSLTQYLISNVGKEFSYNKLKKNFALGSVNTIISFLDYLEDSYLLFTISKFDYSFKKQVNNPKKVYAIDTGLIRANTVSLSSDIGRMLENVVFLALKRNENDIFYFSEENECDFIVKTHDKITDAYQVCYNLTPDNQKREINGMLEALKKFNLSKGQILTFNQEDNFKLEGKQIDVIPCWKWLYDFEK